MKPPVLEAELWVWVKLSGGGHQALVVIAHVHGKAAVAAAPVVAVGGETVGGNKKSLI